MLSALLNADASQAASDSNENDHLAAHSYWLERAAGTPEGHARTPADGARPDTRSFVRSRAAPSAIRGNNALRHPARSECDHGICAFASKTRGILEQCRISATQCLDTGRGESKC